MSYIVCFETMFRSLFLWIGRFNIYDLRRRVDAERVSILVLVDRAIQPAIAGFIAGALMFRSLFLWIGRFNHHSICTVRRRRLRFRSLFLWIGRFNGGRLLTTCPLQLEFRSLFLWIGRFNGFASHAIELVPQVSILVLVDRAIQPRPQAPSEEDLPVSILVLVDRAIQRQQACGFG